MTNINTKSGVREADELLARRLGRITSVAELSSYIQGMLSGLRSLAQQREQRDLAFLGYLLTLAELEARELASRTHN